MEGLMMVERFCPPNVSLSDVLEGKISLCLIDTATSPLQLLIAVIAGLHQAKLYRRFSTPVEGALIRPSKLFKVQILFQILLPLIGISSFILHVAPVSGGYKEQLTGVAILDLLTIEANFSQSVLLLI